jgi:small multidrug resistance pump
MDSWISLIIAIIFGALGTICMKLSKGLQKIKPSLCLFLFYIISFIALTFAIKYIDLSMVYAVWSGLGTVFVSTVGILYFKESVSVKKIIYLSLIVIGVIGMHFSEGFY